MPKLPKLKLTMPHSYPEKELIRDMTKEEFNRLMGICEMLVVEGKVINSYDELVKLSAQDCYKDKKLLEGRVFGKIIPLRGG